MGKEKEDPCQREACAIQSCLQANDYQESKCQSVIQALYDCCAKIGDQESMVCSGMQRKEKLKQKP